MTKSQQDVLSLIEMIHFKNTGSPKELEKNWKKWKKEARSVKFPVISSHSLFLDRMKRYITDDIKASLINMMLEDSIFFRKVINLFDELRSRSALPEKILSQNEDIILSDIREREILKNIEDFGVAKYEGLFSEEDLSTLINFQNAVGKSIESEINHSGYISMHRTGDISFHVKHHRTKANHGLTRLQSKSMGFFHPGSDVLIKNPHLRAVFKSYYRNTETEFHRATMEWVYPAPYNHNGWHSDLIRNQLKVQILLDDVNFENAPMFYAAGSHRISNDFELKIKHAIFNYGLDKKMCLGKMWKNHEATVEPCHVGYLSDEVVDNVPEKITTEQIQIDKFKYDKFICTGKRGDCIFFESSGFHSGNIARKGVRKDIVLTCPDRFPFKNKFLDFIGKSSC